MIRCIASGYGVMLHGDVTSKASSSAFKGFHSAICLVAIAWCGPYNCYAHASAEILAHVSEQTWQFTMRAVHVIRILVDNGLAQSETIKEEPEASPAWRRLPLGAHKTCLLGLLLCWPTLAWVTLSARRSWSRRWIRASATTLPLAGTGSRATICASFTWTAASASGRGLHNFSWTSCPPGHASLRRSTRYRLSATGSFFGSFANSSGLPQSPPPPTLQMLHRSSTGRSRPIHADHTETDLAALKSAQRQAASAQRLSASSDGPPPARAPLRRPLRRWHGLAMEVPKDGTDLHLASFCLVDAELRLAYAVDHAFKTL